MYTGLGFRPTRWQQRWEDGVDVTTLAGNIVLDGRSGNIQRLDPNGAARNVGLPVEEESNGLMFWFANASSVAGENLVIRNDAPATIATFGPGESGLVACDGSAWVPVIHTGSQADIDALLASVTALDAAAVTVITRQVFVADLDASAGSQVFAFAAAVPAKALILARGLDLAIVFAGGGSAAVTVDFGESVDPDGYFDGEDVFTGATTGAIVIPSTPGALLLDQAADFSVAARTGSITVAADVDVDLLTTGSITAWIAYVATPLGTALPG